MAASNQTLGTRLFGARDRAPAEAGVLLAFALFCAVLALFVVYPTLKVLSYPGLSEYWAVLRGSRWLNAARNSILITILSTTSATLVGFVFAFAVTRRDVPGRRLFELFGMLPLFAPPFMVAFSYILMFGRQGLVSNRLFGMELDLFGPLGLWLSQTIAFFPLSMMIIKGTLEGIHPSVEQAALTLGATESRALWTVTLPLVRPGVVGAMLVLAITVLADFGNAVVIAGNYPLLATSAWFMLDGLADLNGASVIVAILLVPTVALFLASRALTARGSYVTVTGRGASIDQIRTPLPVRIAVVAVCGIVSLFVVLLYLGIFMAGLTAAWGSDWSLSFRHWVNALSHWNEMWYSLIVSVVAALVTAVLGQIAAFLMSRELPFKGVIDFLAVLPGALPGVFVGIGFVLAFNGPPVELAGSMWIIVFALGFWHLPLAYQATSATLAQIHKSIEDAARDLGASELRLIWDIYVPMLSRSLIASFLQSFIRSISNISIVVFLVAPGNVVVTFTILQMIGGGDWGGAAALTTFLLIITFACVGVASLVAGRNSFRIQTAAVR
jgi:iron(III) transport system permease protein